MNIVGKKVGTSLALKQLLNSTKLLPVITELAAIDQIANQNLVGIRRQPRGVSVETQTC